ncbi:MAG TPA: hypothetical protein VL860_09720, partial [Planctomycetota bacterium]|nr:hypothetical protein [Planctomycetota bacterium]
MTERLVEPLQGSRGFFYRLPGVRADAALTPGFNLESPRGDSKTRPSNPPEFILHPSSFIL